MGRVEGKVAVITGGASGLGEASAKLLAKEGATVVVTDLNESAGDAVAQAIRSDGGEALYLRHDVTDEAGWESVYATVVERYGRVDVLVNSAGLGIGSAPEDQTMEDWRKLMAVNLDGVFLGTKHALRTMKQHKPLTDGSIINLSSIEGLVGDPGLGAYNASKGGVRLYTKSVALYCGKNGLGVRVNSVHPGYIWTAMVENLLTSRGNVEEGRKALDAMHPIGHVGEPDDIAYGVLYLASDESKFVTGAELVIDGGYTAQ